MWQQALYSAISSNMNLGHPVLNVIYASVIGILFGVIIQNFEQVTTYVKEYLNYWWSGYERTIILRYGNDYGTWYIPRQYRERELLIKDLLAYIQDKTEVTCRTAELDIHTNYESRIGFRKEIGEPLKIEDLGHYFYNGDIQVGKIHLSFEESTINEEKRQSREYIVTIKASTEEEVNQFLTEIADHGIERRKKEENTRSRYIFNLQNGYEDDTPLYSEIEFSSQRTFDSIFFRKRGELKQYLDYFLQRTGPFARPETVRKLGIILWGPAGTGKSSVVKAICNYLYHHGETRDIYNINLNLIKNDTMLYEIFHDKNRKKKIILMEDVTDQGASVLLKETEEKKKNEDFEQLKSSSSLESSSSSSSSTSTVAASAGVTYSGLLNCIDGSVEFADGIFIMTTNHRDRIKSSLLRKGRITLDIYMGPMQVVDLTEMLLYYFPHTDPKEWSQIVSRLENHYQNNLTAACIESMLFDQWNSHLNSIVDVILEKSQEIIKKDITTTK